MRTLDVRSIPHRERHARIFESVGTLIAGEGLVLVNDHDPKPLHYQLDAERPGTFSWEYLEEGPDDWRVRIVRRAGLS